MSDKKSPVENMNASAKPINGFTQAWYGFSPLKLECDDPENLEVADLLGNEITICGFSRRSGEMGDFAVVCCIPKDTQRVSTFVTGGKVILRKLGLVADKNGFPVNGTILQPEGKRYYDFI